MRTPQQELDRLRELAHSLDCLPDEDVQMLGGVKPSTTENWRKRGEGPPYVLFGNRFLYPRQPLAEFLKKRLRERDSVPAKAVL